MGNDSIDRGQRLYLFYLCGWLALALGVHISTAHPTFQRYYLLTVPFLAILTVVGLYWITAQMFHPKSGSWSHPKPDRFLARKTYNGISDHPIGDPRSS